MFECTFSTENDAFRGDPIYKAQEIQRILGNISRLIEDGITSGSCIDINGNKVGSWAIKEDVA